MSHCDIIHHRGGKNERGKIKSIIIPLLADHVLREVNHFIRILKSAM